MDYSVFGTGPKNLVIIPGLSIKAVTPDEPVLALSFASFCDDFTIYLFDRRQDPPEDYTIRDIAEDTVEVIKYLGLEKYSLYGASQGGMVCEIISLEHPENVEKAVLAATSAYTTDTLYKVISGWIDIAKTGDGYRLNEECCREIFTKEFFEKYEDALLSPGKTVTQKELDDFIIIARSLLHFDIRGDLPDIKVPVLVVGAAGDTVMTGEASQYLAKELGAQLVMYGEEYAHAVYNEAPDFRLRMLEFLRG